MIRIFTALLLLGALCTGSAAAREHRLTIGNDDFESTLLAADGRIRAVSLLDKKNGAELLAPNGEPLFEFAVNGRTVNSDMPLWDYASATEEKLANGGTIVSYTFTGRKWLQGLRVTLDREYFPDGAFLRERLRLRAARPGTFRLTNVGNRNRFIFPRYTFTQADGDAPTEMRIGTYGREVLPGYDPARADDRRPDRNLATCHMFHPDFIVHRARRGGFLRGQGTVPAHSDPHAPHPDLLRTRFAGPQLHDAPPADGQHRSERRLAGRKGRIRPGDGRRPVVHLHGSHPARATGAP